MSVSSTSGKLSNGAVHDVLMRSIASGDAALVNGMAARSLSSAMGQDEVVKMNLMAIRRIDGQVEAIHSTVPQVVLYQYDNTNNTWERTPVEGTLFVYSRVSSPGHGFMILNRLSSDNMHDLLSPDLEFRVQKSFVLFKRSSGRILGLCFQEEQLCQEIGELLTNLSGGISNGYSSETRSMTASMRSSSAPAIHKQARTYPASSSHHKVDVLEMLETAGRCYLGQPFSDDADSQDSDPITFDAIPTYDHQQHAELARKSRASKDHRSSEPSAAAKPRNKGGRNSHGTRSTSPKNIPGVSPAAQMPQSFSMSPKQTRHRASSLKQNGSTSHRQRGQLQHASSFSSKSYPVIEQKERNGSLPSSRSTSPFSTSPQKKHNRTREPYVEADGGSADADRIVRKLFGPDTASGHCEPTTATSSSSSSGALQTLFSQSSGENERVSPNTVSADKGSDLLQLKAISLAEVEQQMKAEVPSPERAVPFTLFNSTSHTPPDAHSGRDRNVSLDETAQVLLQPSAFVTTPLSTSVNSPQVTTAITTEYAYSPSQGAHQFAQNVSSSPAQTSTSAVGHSHPLPSTPGSVSILVAPPSPVVTQNPSSGTFMSPTTHTRLTQSFPPIPPLMHSPGMKAAPIVAKKNGKEHSSSDGKKSHAVEHSSSKAVHNLHVSFDEAVPDERHRITQRSRTVSEPSVFANRTSSTSEYTAQTTVPASSGLAPLPELDVSHSSTAVPSTLMSPMQFATRQNKDTVSQDVFDGLTLEQFQQALVYLIQHDDDFLGKVHQAYQKSLAEKQPRT